MYLSERPVNLTQPVPNPPLIPASAVRAPRLRKAFVFSVQPGKVDEYQKRHNPIWQELADTLKRHGAHAYSIYHHPETNQLFGYVEIEDEARWNAIAQTEVCKRWWKHMSEIMPSEADGRPIGQDLREVFHLD